MSHELTEARALIEEQQKELEKEKHETEVERGIRVLYQQRAENLQTAANNLRFERIFSILLFFINISFNIMMMTIIILILDHFYNVTKKS